ncbi:MAG: phenylalanine--tRNA ligase subunit beta [Deltaproteobacteria bacterium]|nr:phenylalanine--tRNA ligase subunit beta [Deltaproteobacteria bacterium]
MKAPLSWLREFVTIEAKPEELCDRLTMAGLEVETVNHIEPGFTDVFVARVVGVERHPNADRLSLCDIDAGAAGRFRVVCGAPNVHAGMAAALARVGARLSGGVHGQGSGSLDEAQPLQAAVIRGVPSEGMLCSELELGLSTDHQGIVELDSDAKPGEPLQNYLQLPDVVLDVAITPNRGDCLSILGLAREISALFGAKLQPYGFRKTRQPAGVNGVAELAIDVEIRAPELCPRYAAFALNGVKVGVAPVWMRRRLELCGMRSVNNVVDVTNYVMLGIGQPLHAFDFTQVADQRIIVRRAAEVGQFETLDGICRTLQPDDLLIADHERPLAIAGVMGGRNSEVLPSTETILLESAYFEPIAIARTARRLNLRSEASYRFERGIDRAGQVRGILLASELLGRVAGAKPASRLIDIEPRPAAERRIELDIDALNSLLGTDISLSEARRRLKSLGAQVEADGRNRLVVVPPSFRPDLNEPADLAEEVARLAGLSEIPASLPSRSTSVAPPNEERRFVKKLRDIMVGCGMVEAKTLAFIAPVENQRFPGFFAGKSATAQVEPLKVVNPLSAELSEMRLSLLPGLMAALRFNLNREASAFHSFEIGKVFSLVDGNGAEAQRLGAISYGDYAMGGVDRPAVEAGFFTVKGMLDACFLAFGIRGVLFEPAQPDSAPFLHPGRAAQFSLDGATLGFVGELHPAEALRLELNHPCVLFEVDLANLMTYSNQGVLAVRPPPRFPAVRRDLALVIGREVSAGTVVRTVQALDVALLESVELFDVYQGESIPEGKKSIALACLYRSKDRTLTDEEVNRAHNLVIEQARLRLGAELRL